VYVVEVLDCNKFPPVGASYQLKNGVGSVELEVTEADGTAYPHCVDGAEAVGVAGSAITFCTYGELTIAQPLIIAVTV
jgi:hypothetical protein